MPPINFEIAPHVPPIKAVSHYLPPDCALEVVPEGELPRVLHRISFDTLTLSFSPDKDILIALDAYTNAARWERQSLNLPLEEHRAALICTEDFDENGIGLGGSGPLRYVYDKENELLRVIFDERSSTKYVRCLSCVVAGLADDWSLNEFWIDGVKI
jgi:hypothetical protein